MQIVIKEILTNYEVFGVQNKKTILILHGWGQNIENWRIVAYKLSEKFKVVLLDLPGFGSSSIPNSIFTTHDYSIFVNEFINKINIDNYILIGHSFGGKIAIKNSVEKHRISKLFLISPSGIDKKSFLTEIKIILTKILRVFGFWVPKSIIKKFLTIFASSDYINSGEMHNIFKSVVSEKVVLDAKKIKCPTIIMWGENDKEINIKTSKILKSLIKNSTLRILWGMGHSPNIENPEKLSLLLLEYL